MEMVSIGVVNRLPVGHFIVRKEETTDIDGKVVPALLVRWRDNTGLRLAYFHQQTGDYLGDAYEDEEEWFP